MTSKRRSIKKAQSFIPTSKNGFFDPQRIIIEDAIHSHKEERYFCIGEVEGGILTVRFTYREKVIRIIGAGYWRNCPCNVVNGMPF